MRAFGRLLGVGDREMHELLVQAESSAIVEGRRSLVAGAGLCAGISVCFTGSSWPSH